MLSKIWGKVSWLLNALKDKFVVEFEFDYYYSSFVVYVMLPLFLAPYQSQPKQLHVSFLEDSDMRKAFEATNGWEMTQHFSGQLKLLNFMILDSWHIPKFEANWKDAIVNTIIAFFSILLCILTNILMIGRLFQLPPNTSMGRCQ